MKSPIAFVAVLLFAAPFSNAETGKRPVAIHVTVLANERKKEIAAQTIIVPETEVARIQIESKSNGVIDLSFSPAIAGDQVRLTMRSFPKDKEGKDIESALCRAYIMKLDSPVSMQDGVVTYEVVASLNIPATKKMPNQAPEPTTTSVTSPADAGAAPAAVVAHL